VNGSMVRGFQKPRRISAINGPAAGGAYVLRKGPNVKVPPTAGFAALRRISPPLVWRASSTRAFLRRAAQGAPPKAQGRYITQAERQGEADSTPAPRLLARRRYWREGGFCGRTALVARQPLDLRGVLCADVTILLIGGRTADSSFLGWRTVLVSRISRNSCARILRARGRDVRIVGLGEQSRATDGSSRFKFVIQASRRLAHLSVVDHRRAEDYGSRRT
jgi:hypothetical protein